MCLPYDCHGNEIDLNDFDEWSCELLKKQRIPFLEI